MDKVQILEQIKTSRNLLSLPQVLSEILHEIGNEDLSTDSLSKIILKDPSLTSRILSMSNSSFYQRYSEIKTVNQAISILGVTTVKCLVLSTSVFHPEKISKDTGLDPKELFAHILSVAAACKKIADATSYSSTEEAFITGLLHKLGMMFFLTNYPKQYRKILNHEVPAESIFEAEEKLFGINHCEIGFHISDNWHIPNEIKKAIYNYNNVFISNDETNLELILKLAVLLTKEHYSGYEISLEERLTRINHLSEKLALTKTKVDEISSSILTDTFEIAEYLGVDIGDFENMLTKANQEIWKSYVIIENLFKERQELSKNLLSEERARGAIESKNIAMATLSHYLNNAVMSIYGRSQIMRMLVKKGQTDKVVEKLPDSLDKIDTSIKKIVAVLEEMKNVSPIDQKKFDKLSRSMNIDDLIEKRMNKMNKAKNWEEDPVSKP